MSFRSRTIIGVAAIEAVLLLILVWSVINYLRTSNESELIKRAESTLALLSRASRDAVLSYDLATLNSIAQEAVKTPSLYYVRIIDSDNNILAIAGDAEVINRQFIEDLTYDDVDDGIYDTATPINESSTLYGRIEIGLSTGHIENTLSEAIREASLIALLEMVLVALFSFLLGTYLTRQLYRLIEGTEKITQGEYGYQIDASGNDELALAAQAFNRMSSDLKNDISKQNAMMRSALDCIIGIDAQGRVIDFNETAEKTFGYRKSQVIGKPMKECIIPPSLREQHTEGMNRYLATGESHIIDKHIEVTAMRSSGEEFPVEMAVTELEINGEKQFTAFVRDISERVRYQQALMDAKEAAESADRAKSRFLAHMSHEIRTPLNSLLGFLNLLKESRNVTEEQRTWINTAQQSGDSLLALINDTLDLSKIEAGKIELEPTPFNPHALIESTMSILSQRAKAKGLDYTCTIDPDVPTCIEEDSARLRQILINLIGNAVKFTDKGSIKVAVSKLCEKSGDMLLFEIIDTGQGIPASRHDEIFHEFNQVSSNRIQKFSGTGLGLAISKSLVELMHGEIGFESSENMGTHFWFKIPLKTASPALLTTRDREPDHQEAALESFKGRVLLVDDSPANLMVATAMLKNSGLTIDTASNGLEAVEASQQLPYDLVLMDISMPEMDGFEATAAIRKLPGKNAQVPIIAMTAHALHDELETHTGSGMNDYIAKPVMKQVLYQKLAKWLNRNDEPSIQDGVTSASSHTSEEGPGPELIDTRVLEQLARDTSAETVPRMLDSFCTETRERVTRLMHIRAGEATDITELKREAHTLKSCASTFGAIQLRAIAESVEAACHGGEFDKATDKLDQLIDTCERTLTAMQDLLEIPSK